MNPLELTGRARSHVVSLREDEIWLHRDVVAPFRALRAAARADGIRLALVSGFRDFERQLQIWNAKIRGDRELLDRDGAALDRARLSETELIEAVLAWSALPGASRHHWGSDIDVYDAAVAPTGDSRAPLVPREWETGGVYKHLDVWLHDNLSRFGFYRPYDRDRGGVCAEPWHISHIEVSSDAIARLHVEIIAEAWTAAPVAAKETVLAHLPRLVARYVYSVAAPVN